MHGPDLCLPNKHGIYKDFVCVWQCGKAGLKGQIGYVRVKESEKQMSNRYFAGGRGILTLNWRHQRTTICCHGKRIQCGTKSPEHVTSETRCIHLLHKLASQHLEMPRSSH